MTVFLALLDLDFTHDKGQPGDDIASRNVPTPSATRVVQGRGRVFMERAPVQPSVFGALTQRYQGGISFDLVRSVAKQEPI